MGAGKIAGKRPSLCRHQTSEPLEAAVYLPLPVLWAILLPLFCCTLTDNASLSLFLYVNQVNSAVFSKLVIDMEIVIFVPVLSLWLK